jgi:hypothetical protein
MSNNTTDALTAMVDALREATKQARLGEVRPGEAWHGEAGQGFYLVHLLTADSVALCRRNGRATLCRCRMLMANRAQGAAR